MIRIAIENRAPVRRMYGLRDGVKCGKLSSAKARRPTMQVREREDGDIERLTALVSREGRGKQRDRYRMALLALKGWEAQQIAEALSSNRRTVQAWVYRYRDAGIESLRPRPLPGRAPKLPREREAEFKARLDAGPREDDGVCTLRGKDALRILEHEFGVSYSLDGVYDLLDRLGYSCLKPRPRHEKNDPAALQKFKKAAPLLSAP
jgi:transposase